MPVYEESQGLVLKKSPYETELSTTWSMNFAAGCEDCSPVFMDTKDDRVPLVHPMLLPACIEVVGAFDSLYSAGLTKDELIRNTFVHHFHDVEIVRPLKADEVVHSHVTLAKVQQKKNGIHTGTAFQHKDANGNVISRGYFAGVLLGYKGGDKKKATSPMYQPEPISTKLPLTETMELKIRATAAHVWDACIRNPRVPKAKSTDINVHTNIGFAQKAGLPARTFTGLALLSIVVSKLLKTVDPVLVKRICCTFSAPFYLLYDDVPVFLKTSTLPKSSTKPSDHHDDNSNNNLMQQQQDEFLICFDVTLADNTKILTNGKLLLTIKQTPSSQL